MEYVDGCDQLAAGVLGACIVARAEAHQAGDGALRTAPRDEFATSFALDSASQQGGIPQAEHSW